MSLLEAWERAWSNADISPEQLRGFADEFVGEMRAACSADPEAGRLNGSWWIWHTPIRMSGLSESIAAAGGRWVLNQFGECCRVTFDPDAPLREVTAQSRRQVGARLARRLGKERGHVQGRGCLYDPPQICGWKDIERLGLCPFLRGTEEREGFFESALGDLRQEDIREACRPLPGGSMRIL